MTQQVTYTNARSTQHQNSRTHPKRGLSNSDCILASQTVCDVPQAYQNHANDVTAFCSSKNICIGSVCTCIISTTSSRRQQHFFHTMFVDFQNKFLTMMSMKDVSNRLCFSSFKQRNKQEAVQRHCGCYVPTDQSLENMTLWRVENMTPTPGHHGIPHTRRPPCRANHQSATPLRTKWQ